MAKQYRKTESGLVVPECLASRRTRHAVSSNRGFMFSPGGGSCGCCGCTITCGGTTKTVSPDGTAEWVSHSIGEDGTIAQVSNSADCVTYYVESQSGNVTETGTGTEDDPWVNLNTVFKNACINATCASTSCPVVKILLSGVVDYKLDGGYGYNEYHGRLVIEPLDSETALSVSVNVITSGYAVGNLQGVIFKRINASVTRIGLGHASVFGLCNNSTFNDCSASITGGDVNDFESDICFESCQAAVFDNCTATMIGSSIKRTLGFYDCQYSTFRECYSDLEPTQSSSGWESCTSSVFNDCTASITGGASSIGFNSCESSIFFNCSVVASSTNYSYGYQSNRNSAFKECSANLSLTGTGCLKSCGFFLNSSSSFLDCVTTDRVCTSACSGCGTFVCDI